MRFASYILILSLITNAVQASDAVSSSASVFEKAATKAGELAYDAWSLYDRSSQCEDRNPELEKLAVHKMAKLGFRKVPQNPEQHMGAVKAQLASANAEALKCDIQLAKGINGSNETIWNNIKAKLADIQKLDEKLAEKKREVMGKSSTPKNMDRESARAFYESRKKELEPILELEKARDFLKSSLPFSDDVRVTSILDRWLKRHGTFGEIEFGISQDKVLQQLQRAYSGIEKDLSSDLSRMEKASANAGEGLNINDLNRIVQDPSLFTEITNSDSKIQEGLKPMMCQLNRSYGKGQDYFENAMGIAGILTLPIGGGASLVGNALKGSVWAARSRNLISSRSFFAIAQASAKVSMASNGAGLAQAIERCRQDHPHRAGSIGRTEYAQSCTDVTQFTAEQEFQACLFTAVFPGALVLASGVYRTAQAGKKLQEVIKPPTPPTPPAPRVSPLTGIKPSEKTPTNALTASVTQTPVSPAAVPVTAGPRLVERLFKGWDLGGGVVLSPAAVNAIDLKMFPGEMLDTLKSALKKLTPKEIDYLNTHPEILSKFKAVCARS